MGLVGLTLLSGCLAAAHAAAAPLWSQFGCENTLSSQSSVAGPGAGAPYRVTQLDTNGPVFGSPSVDAAGNVFVGSSDNHLYAFSESTQEAQWSFRADGNVWGAPAVTAAGTVVVCTSAGSVFGVWADNGTQAWAQSFAPPTWQLSPSLSGDGETLYVPTGTTELVALDAATGDTVWTTTLPALPGTAIAVSGTGAHTMLYVLGLTEASAFVLMGTLSRPLPVDCTPQCTFGSPQP